MTIADAVNKLFVFFMDNDSFELERDFIKVMLVSDNEEEDRAILLASIQQLKENELIRSQRYKGKTYHILSNKIQSYEQTIPVGGVCALMMSTEINEMCDALGDVRDYCDPTKIGEKDIINLINIIKIYRNQKEEDNF